MGVYILLLWLLLGHWVSRLHTFNGNHDKEVYVNKLVQERCNSIANALDLLLSYTNPLTYTSLPWLQLTKVARLLQVLIPSIPLCQPNLHWQTMSSFKWLITKMSFLLDYTGEMDFLLRGKWKIHGQLQNSSGNYDYHLYHLYIYGLMQKRYNSGVLAMELHLFCMM